MEFENNNNPEQTSSIWFHSTINIVYNCHFYGSEKKVFGPSKMSNFRCHLMKCLWQQSERHSRGRPWKCTAPTGVKLPFQDAPQIFDGIQIWRTGWPLHNFPMPRKNTPQIFGGKPCSRRRGIIMH